MRFGISTHLYHDQKLERAHLGEVAAHGFDGIELFATRSHFDYRHPAAVESLAQWLDETGLALFSVHAPITDAFGAGDVWSPTYSNALSDSVKRQSAVQEAEAALQIARRVPFPLLVVHLGTPDSRANPGDNNRSAAVKSAEAIVAAAAPLGVRVALEIIPNSVSTPASLAAILDDEIDSSAAGVCFDFGHAFLGGDVPDAIETVAEHLIATHVHDNHRREDEHLVPYRGAINWDTALMSMQKIGYDGTYLMELANTSTPAAVLEQAQGARVRLERALSQY
ncbi:sugar phosphate isomerase/epimerase [soil metagenome]|jgi:sugar phosphate isomerase/epimerase|nr:sugar phosphate isomerase/epimerase [Acidobacteriota bacterium]